MNKSIHQILKQRDLTLGRLTCSLLSTQICAEVAGLVGPAVWEITGRNDYGQLRLRRMRGMRYLQCQCLYMHIYIYIYIYIYRYISMYNHMWPI